jgi:hypothetical protein
VIFRSWSTLLLMQWKTRLNLRPSKKSSLKRIPSIYKLINVDFYSAAQDPLIYNQMVDVAKHAEIGISDGLSSFAGYPMGTRPISKGAEPVKV